MFRWMQLAIDARKKDIVHRLSAAKSRKEERN